MRTLKFRFWNERFKRMDYGGGDCLLRRQNDEPTMQFTGFTDKHGKEIYEGDILSDWNEVDGKMVQSKMQVYWCDKTGAWKLDNSYKQDKSSGDLLSDEQAEFFYEITRNIHETTKTI